MNLELSNLITPVANAVDVQLAYSNQSPLFIVGETYILTCRQATAGSLSLVEPSGNNGEPVVSAGTTKTLTADGYQVRFVAEFPTISLVGTVTSGPFKIKITNVR